MKFFPPSLFGIVEENLYRSAPITPMNFEVSYGSLFYACSVYPLQVMFGSTFMFEFNVLCIIVYPNIEFKIHADSV